MGILLAFSVVFGGASRENVLRLAIVELGALPALALGLAATFERRSWIEHPFAFRILVAVTALTLVQLVPLPAGIWTHLPGRSDSNLAFSLAGIAPPWAPISLSPELTWRSFLALVPPVASFLIVILLPVQDRRRLVGLAIGLAALSLLLGAAQLTAGRHFYPYATTAAGDVVGFFANRNHLATLCLMTTPFAAVLLGAAAKRRRPADRLTVWACGVFLVLALFGLVAIRSRAGILFAVPAFALGGIAAWQAAGRGLSWKRLAAGGAVLVALAGAGYFGGQRILQRFEGGAASTQSRLDTWPVIAKAADEYLPLGSGIGSFDAIYRAHEPLDFVDPTFLNHAHNEYLETWLEAGWPGAILIAVFLVWFTRRTISVWRRNDRGDPAMQRAASVAILVVLLHSLVDYPLRTETIAVMFAIVCAILESRVPDRNRRPSAA